MLHIWHEDKHIESFTHKFWCFLKNNGTSTELQNAEIIGFNGFIHLYQHIKSASFNKNDRYIIFMDYVLDNDKVIKVYAKTKELLKPYKNVYLQKVLCQEYFMLLFKNIDTWLKPTDSKLELSFDELCRIKNEFIHCIESGQHTKWVKYPILKQYMTKYAGLTPSTANLDLILLNRLEKFQVRGK